MFSGSPKPRFQLGLLMGVVVALAVFVPAGFAQHKTDTNTQYPHIDLDHPENYIGQEVTLVGDVDKIHSGTTFVMEAKDQGTKDHILVISVAPDAHPQGEVKEGKPVTATGTIRMLDRSELERDYGPIDFGSTPLEKFDGKPILVLGSHQTAQLQEPVQPIEREKPTVTEPAAPAPEPQAAAPEQNTSANANTELPRTASPLPAIGLSGLLSLMTGLGIRLFRRQEK